MFTLDDLKHTRVYQDAKQEGMQQGMQKAILRLLSRKFGQITPELKLQVETLATPQLENLTESLLDFASITDLETRLHDNT
ncbi:MAG: DUF4351 domain-containing protein [Pseudanabaena sp. CRU_2_10]|nr:DUF4351 domain-containing protein [Pseudanabaena sp. CRU_2_10]